VLSAFHIGYLPLIGARVVDLLSTDLGVFERADRAAPMTGQNVSNDLKARGKGTCAQGISGEWPLRWWWASQP